MWHIHNTTHYTWNDIKLSADLDVVPYDFSGLKPDLDNLTGHVLSCYWQHVITADGVLLWHMINTFGVNLFFKTNAGNDGCLKLKAEKQNILTIPIIHLFVSKPWTHFLEVSHFFGNI